MSHIGHVRHVRHDASALERAENTDVHTLATAINVGRRLVSSKNKSYSIVPITPDHRTPFCSKSVSGAEGTLSCLRCRQNKIVIVVKDSPGLFVRASARGRGWGCGDDEGLSARLMVVARWCEVRGVKQKS